MLMEMSEEIGELAKALALAQKDIKGAGKNQENPFTKKSYADLGSIWEAASEALANNSLAIMQPLENDENHIIVVTMLAHSSGQWIRGRLSLPPVGNKSANAAQQIGSAITYGRRYSLAAMVGVVTEDDDGVSSGKPGTQQAHGSASKAPEEVKRSADLLKSILKLAAEAKDAKGLEAAIKEASDLLEPDRRKLIPAYKKRKEEIEANPKTELPAVLASHGVKSSDGESIHTVRVYSGDIYDCTCEAYRFSKSIPKSCKHIARIVSEAEAREDDR